MGSGCRTAGWALLLLAGWAYLQLASVPSPRAAVDEDVPHLTAPLAVHTPGSIEELQRDIAVVLEREHIAGAAIALVNREGPIWVGGIGVSDRATRAPMTADTVFRVGSLSKSVIALGVMRLVDQGKLDVDKPIRELVPDLEIDNAWEAEAPVTLAHCMEHTAGFDDVRFNEIFGAEDISVADALRLNPRSRKTRWKPGTRHGYSNVGYTVAARAIEVATGEPFDVYLRREILDPMGITDADFRRTPSLQARLASGYIDSDEPVVFRPFAHRPSGSLLASANDLGKLARFFLRRDPGIVSEASLARIERAGTLPYPRTAAEYGFANYGDVMHPIITRGHDGGMPGFHSSFRYIPSEGVGYAVLLNSNYTFRGYFEIRALIFAYLTNGKAYPPPPVGKAVARPGAPFYRIGNPNYELFAFIDRVRSGWRVTDRETSVAVAGLDGERFELVPTPDGAYRFPSECCSSVRFTTTSDGTQIFTLFNLYTEEADETTAYVRFAAVSLANRLMAFAPLYAIALLVVGVLRRRRVVPTAVLVWPAIAGLACASYEHWMMAGFFHGVIGEVHPITVGLFATTILFAIASIATLVCSARTLLRPDRPHLLAMIIPLACGVAFTGYTIWFAANGMIGLRTWAY